MYSNNNQEYIANPNAPPPPYPGMTNQNINAPNTFASKIHFFSNYIYSHNN